MYNPLEADTEVERKDRYERYSTWAGQGTVLSQLCHH